MNLKNHIENTIDNWLRNNIYRFLPETLEFNHHDWGSQILACNYSSVSLDTEILVPSYYENIDTSEDEDIYLEIDTNVTISDINIEGDVRGFHEFGEDDPYIEESATLLIKGQISGNIKLNKGEIDNYCNFRFSIEESKWELG